MVKTIKLNKTENFFYDPDENKILPMYSDDLKERYPNFKLRIKLPDASVLTVDNENIKKEYGGDIVVQYNNDKFIIDDGYQPVLCKAGYIVYKDYDKRKEYDREKGEELSEYITELIKDGVCRLYSDNDVDSYYVDVDNTIYGVSQPSKSGFKYKIIISNVSSIVEKNQIRKDNSLPYYPFSTDMDRYGTLYLSIFATKLEEKCGNKYAYSDTFVKKLITALGPDFHFISQPIRKRLVLFDEK